MSLQRPPIWRSRVDCASPLDRRTLLVGGGTFAITSLFAPPLFAREPTAYPAPDRELMVSVPGGRIYVRVNGRLDGSRLPIVFIHGGPGGNHAAYLDALALADERAVILYDQLDSGLSDRPSNPSNWTVERFTAEVDAVRRAIGIGRWHVLGHSWGGTVALEYGARRPRELAGLIVASPLVSTRSWIADANALRAELPLEVQRTLKSCDPPAPVTPPCEAAARIFYANFNGREPRSDGLLAYVGAHPALRLNRRLYETMWGTSEFIATGTLRNYNGEPLLLKLNGPHTLFIDGQYDEARPTTLEGFAARVPGAEFAVVPGAAHGFFNDRPEEALGVLRPWLRRQDVA